METANETATVETMQDNADRLEQLLYPEESQDAEPNEDAEEEVTEDAIELPEDGDSDSEDEEGSEGLDDIAEGEDLTLADYLGIDDERIVVGDDGVPLFNAIIDGETKQVPLKDLAANFQLQSHVNNKSMALEEQRKEFEGVREQVAQELQQRVQGVTKLGELAENELVSEYNSIDWNTLRTQDPANWTALRQEYAERAQKVQQVKDLAREEGLRLQQETQAKFKEAADEYFSGELRSMIADNPEWADETVRSSAMTEMRSFMTRYGFTEADAQGVNDHRLIRLIKDAKAYRDGKKTAETKRVNKKLPKFQKPGGKTNAANLAKARNAKALKAKVKKTGHVKDVAASIIDRM